MVDSLVEYGKPAHLFSPALKRQWRLPETRHMKEVLLGEGLQRLENLTLSSSEIGEQYNNVCLTRFYVSQELCTERTQEIHRLNRILRGALGCLFRPIQPPNRRLNIIAARLE